MRSPLTRRSFLRNAALGAAAATVLKPGASAFGFQANERLNVALIGVGGRGSWFVRTIPDLGQNVVAMCDVNERKAGPYFEAIPTAKKYLDFRKMLDEMGKQIDAVVVATPDHTHAAASAMAIRMGKHVLCEKPLTHNIHEAGVVAQLASEHKVATQMGNQGTASQAYRRATEIIWAGVLGDIKEVHVWNTGGGPGRRPYPSDEHDVPGYFHWDLWLGPAEYRPYNSRWVDGWHGWRDFGTGALGNWASHTMNLPFRALKFDVLWDDDSPAQVIGSSKKTIRVHAQVEEICTDTLPRWEIIHYDIPARAGLPAVTLHWYNGPGQAPGPREMIEQRMERRLDWGDAGGKEWHDHAGCLLIGDKGMIHSNGHNTEFTLLPKEKFEGFEGPPQTLARSRGHEREWLDACKGGPAAMSNFDLARRLIQFVHLGNVATLYDEPIEFDPVRTRVVAPQKANESLRREYREGWSL